MFLAQGDNADGGGSLLLPILMIVALFAIFYFMAIRPNQRRRQQLQKLQSDLSVGDEVMTSSGLYGTVAELDEKTVILETSEGVYSRYARQAVMEVVSSAHAPAESGADAGSEGGPESATGSRDSKD